MMEMIRWSFDRRKVVRAYFDKFPGSTFYFRRIRSFYFLYSSDWDRKDPVLSYEDKEVMQKLVNAALGRDKAYHNRKSIQKQESSR